MTTIAANTECMACDSQITDEGGAIIGTQQTKIHRIKGDIIGIAGDANAEQQILKYFREGKRLKLEGAEYTILQLKTTGRLYRYDDSLDGYEIDSPAAIGSGASFAKAAIQSGKTPRQAIKIASDNDAYTGGKIWSLKLKKSSTRS